MIHKKYVVYVIIGLIIGGTVFSLYHQYRKSNHDERATDITQYASSAVATFAAGCFWCSESDFEKTDGVIEAVSGYTGGETDNPSYKEVSAGTTGHREAVQVFYDPTKVSYDQLLDVFWRHVNPTDEGGQFVDRGTQYSTAIFYHDDEQKAIAEKSKTALEASETFSEPIVTPIVLLKEFFVAEDYHQDYHKKNALRYEYYRDGSGRNKYIEDTWGSALKEAQHHDGNGQGSVTNNQERTSTFKNFVKPSEKELKEQLTPMQYKVTQEDGTERPFDNEYDGNKEQGIYVDVVSGEPLYSSTDKYDSGTGWPSFVKPIDKEFIVEKKDYKLILPRTEIRSKYGDNHIGHVFNDGPNDRGGKRYCMNSAALRFVPKDQLKTQGYEAYEHLFE